MRERLFLANEYCKRIFLSPDFYNPILSKDILFESDVENFYAKNKSVPKDNGLKKEEEIHLFKKMNYFKYKANKLLDSENISENRLKKAEEFIEKAKQIRNIIVESNLRLSGQLLRLDVSYYINQGLVDSLISDAYYDILKSVDYFDWTLGNRFSTYATWVLKKNFFRESKQLQKKGSKFTRIEDTDALNLSGLISSDLELKIDYDSKKKSVNSLLSLLENGNCTKNQKRQVYILERYFGLNGRKNSTLEEISSDLGITKERVRQLKERGVSWLKSRMNEMNVNYDSIIENFRY